ncbi:uncharacterized protein LOC118405771 [Branchiostoma floridae]|uniref:Uncharacterized protein LOC118405771 n=1 Tax=Branchiostoma floridae TaxID=7739 RepID=A0A9J7KG41_BRAFL|nr:uncharacterized protein LOC118405771 [Branchiostoma floridae]
MTQQVAEKRWSAAATSALKHKEFSAALKEKVGATITKEVQSLAPTSILQKTSPDDLVNFNQDEFAEELESRAPWLDACFQGACGTESQKATTAKCTAASICIRVKHPKLSAIQYRNSFALLHGGAKKSTFARLNKQNICMSHKSTIAKQKEMGEDRDEDIKKWKEAVESHIEAISLLETLLIQTQEEDARAAKAGLDTSGNSTISSADLQASGFSFDSFSIQSPCSQDEGENIYEELGVKPLENEDAEANTPATEQEGCPIPNTKSPLIDSMMEIPGFCDGAYQKAAHALETVKSRDKTDSAAVQEAINLMKDTPLPTYQLIVDNLDMEVVAKHQSKDKKSQSLHWVHQMAAKDRVTTTLPDDRPQKPIEDLQISEVMLTEEVQCLLRKDYIVHVTRTLENNLPALSCIKGAAVKHIRHEYTEEMSQPTEETWLGLQFKNENKSGDMVQILRNYQENYIPVKEDEDGCITELLQPVLLGGDWLTEERVHGVQAAFQDGNTPLERFESSIGKHDVWHAARNLTEIYDGEYGGETPRDKGTLCANMNVIGAICAKKGPHQAYNHYKEFMDKDLDATIIHAAMEIFSLPSIDAQPEDFPPPYIRAASRHKQRDWLECRAAEIVDLIFAEETFTVRDIQQGMAPKPKPELPCRYPGCTKVYKRPGSRKSHEESKHGLVVEEEESTNATSSSSEDHVYNYHIGKLTLGLLIRNINDATKEGDGERLSRCFRMALLYYKAFGHTKYAYGTLLFFARVHALLPPRLAHSLKWNRVVNNRGGKGNNIPMDLNLEHGNFYVKSFLKHLGPNLNEQTAARVANSIGRMAKLLKKADRDWGVKRETGYHHKADPTTDIHTLVEQYAQVGVFRHQPGRAYDGFPNIKASVLSAKINASKLSVWMRSLFAKWGPLYE